MTEQIPDSCRAVMAATELSSNSPISYFLSIAMHDQPKWRIKIPKLLIKTKNRKFHFFNKEGNTANHRDNKSTRAEPKNQLTKKLGSAFSYVLRLNNISLGKYFLSGGKNEQIHGGLEKISYQELGNALVCGDEPIVAALSEFLKFEQILEDEDAHKRKHNNRFLSLLEKKKVWSFMCKAKMKKTSYSKNNAAKESGDFLNRFKIIGWRGRSRRLVRVRTKLQMAMSFKKESRRFEENEDNEGGGLCRKRILLGRRCKPLNFSGILNYDEDGPLLPDLLP